MQDSPARPGSDQARGDATGRRRFLVSAARALGAVTVVGAYPAWRLLTRPDAAAPLRRTSWAMGTQVTLSLPADAGADDWTRAVFSELVRIQDLLSAHDERSALSVLNAAGRSVVAAPELREVASAALRFAAQTDGAMDVTVLPALRAYGFMPGTADAAFRDRIGASHLHVDDASVTLDAGGYAVDFGGIAKGYGVDRAVADLRAMGNPAALVDAGGDLFAHGRPAPDRPWKVGIRDPRHVERILGRFDVEDEAVATSGTYFQKRVVDGREVSHLFDPRTAEPVAHVLSATVVAPDAMTADALATAACVLETARCRALFESMPGIEALWVSAEGTITMTEGMRRRVELI